MSRALALAATLLAAAPVAVADVEVATVRLTALCLNTDRIGTGFVVENWLGGGGFLLVTALHVVDHCASVKVEKVACDRNPPMTPVTTLTGARNVWSWPTKDVAAIEISADEKQRLLGAHPAATLPSDDTPLPLGTPLAVLGTSETNPCSGGVGFSTGISRIDNVITTATGGVDLAQLRGSLDAALRVLLYFSPVAHGVSGGPVAVLHTNVVLGVHDGGIEHFPFGWSIALGKRGGAIGEPMPGTLATWPSGFREPKLAQADETALPNTLRDQVADLERRYKRQPYIFSIALPFEFSIVGKQLPAWRFVPQLGFISELKHWPHDIYENAVGVRVAGGAIAGRSRERLLAPDGTCFELHDVNRYGAFAEAALHFRFRRLQWWRVSFDLGLRGSIVGWSASFLSDSLYLYPMVSVPTRARVSLSLSHYHAATAELGAVLDYDRGSDFHYRPSGQLDPPNFGMSLNVGAGIGYEY